jgi:hypothetical protein
MSNEITIAFVEGFKSNILMLSQQKEARLWNFARKESQHSKADFYERIGTVDAQEITTRHGDTPILDTPHSRRQVTLRDAEYGDMIDKMDRVRLLINPDDAYVQAAVMAMNRFKDDRFIEAALGNARGGESGATLVPLPSTQQIACFDGSTATGVNLNVETIIAVGAKFDANDVDESIRKYFAWSSSQKQSLLNTTKATSSDFVSVQALTSGRMNDFYGFEFKRSERLPRSAANTTYSLTDGSVGAGGGTVTAAKSRRCFAWAEDGMLSATGQDIIARIAERADKRFGTQIYVAESVGSTRLEEVKVVEVICSE